MQGEKIGEESGKVTSQRVLPNPNGGPKMETSFQTSITLLGAKATNRCTYWSVVRPGGTLYAEGAGDRCERRGRHGHVGRPGRRHDEQRWRRELSGRRVLSDVVCQMVPTE